MLKGKSVLITGSTSGIGKGMAGAFAKAGCNIMINGFGDADEIKSLLADLEAKNKISALYSAADMGKADQTDQKNGQRCAGRIRRRGYPCQ